jgi:hypothetical protein
LDEILLSGQISGNLTENEGASSHGVNNFRLPFPALHRDMRRTASDARARVSQVGGAHRRVRRESAIQCGSRSELEDPAAAAPVTESPPGTKRRNTAHEIAQANDTDLDNISEALVVCLSVCPSGFVLRLAALDI